MYPTPEEDGFYRSPTPPRFYKLINELEARLRALFPGVNYNFSQAIEDNVEEAMSGVKGENSIKLFGDDLEEFG